MTQMQTTAGLVTQSEARRTAKALNESGSAPTGLVAVAHAYPAGSWGGHEQGWTVSYRPAPDVATPLVLFADQLAMSFRVGLAHHRRHSLLDSPDRSANMLAFAALESASALVATDLEVYTEQVGEPFDAAAWLVSTQRLL